jgi:hypothetical protein
MYYERPRSWINQPCKNGQGSILCTNDCKIFRNDDLVGYVQNVGFIVCCANLKTFKGYEANTLTGRTVRTTTTRKPSRKIGATARKYCENYGVYEPLVLQKNVFGGERSEVGEFPHHVQIYYSSEDVIVTRCGGSLISDRFVITAAHCLNNRNFVPVYVRMGRVREEKLKKLGTTRKTAIPPPLI